MHNTKQWGGWAKSFQAQSSLLAYIDVFWCFAVVAALLIPLAFLLLRAVRQHAAAVSH